MTAVYLVGKRVALRPLEEGDLERCVRWMNDPEVRTFLGNQHPRNLRAQRERWLKMYDSQTEMILAITLRRGGRHIGICGLHRIDSINRNTELGITIGEKAAWGRGYGEDVLNCLLRHAFETLNLHRVFLRCDAFNARGIACYKKCGFREEGRSREDAFREGRYHDTLIMGILRSEWAARGKSRKSGN